MFTANSTPSVPYDACDRQAGRASSLSLIRYKTNDYSVPVAYGHRDVLVRGYVDQVVIRCGSAVIARHRRLQQLLTVTFSSCGSAI